MSKDRPESALSRWSRLKRDGGGHRRGRATPVLAGTTQQAAAPDAVGTVSEAGALARRVGGPDVEAVPGPAEAVAQNRENQNRENQNRENGKDPDSGEWTEERLEEERVRLGLPTIDDLTKESDFQPFMRDGVPAPLRRFALRRLWLLDPVFANLDGLNDYDEDFAAKALFEGVKTVYQVGKGMFAEPEEPEEDEPEGEEQKEEKTAETRTAAEADRASPDEDGETGSESDVPESSPETSDATDSRSLASNNAGIGETENSSTAC